MVQMYSKPVQEKSTPLQVVLLGKIGAGKSASGNTILGRKAFLSKKHSRAVTTKIQAEKFTIEGKDAFVYDTPGFCDPDRSPEEIQEKILNVLKTTSSGPRVFLLVVKTDRLTEEEKNVISKVEEILGESLLKQTWILFTRGDQLEDQTIEQFIAESEGLKEVVRKYSGRYHVFNNKSGDPDQVQTLLKKISPYFNLTVPPISNHPERRIILLGKTGVGKSETGNTILGGTPFHSELNPSSITQKTEVQKGVVDGRMISVVDTPGLFDTQLPVKKMADEIENCLDVSVPGPHAFLIVMPVNVRFTQQEKQAVEILEGLFGSGMSKYAIILFTHGDQLKGYSMEKLINGNDDLSRLVEQCGGRYHVFNNEAKGNRSQVRELMEKIDAMVEENGGTCYTIEEADRAKKKEEERLRMETETLQKEKEIRETRQRKMEIQRMEDGKNHREEQEQERDLAQSAESTATETWIKGLVKWLIEPISRILSLFWNLLGNIGQKVILQ